MMEGAKGEPQFPHSCTHKACHAHPVAGLHCIFLLYAPSRASCAPGRPPPRRGLFCNPRLRQLTSAATMSMMSVGSRRLPSHRRKKFFGGMALNLLAPNTALQGAGRIRAALAVRSW